ncbi:MAG TPA: DUF2846 domain-containing protein [Bryobacteraceae bacterium]|nr:DUF2846 domain-containing protein [Bryobacteraceae bacterium]
MRNKLFVALSFAASVFAQTAATPAPAAVIVYRAPAVMKGRWTHPSVYCDGKELTRIYRGTFFKTTISPGKHIITLGRTEVGQFLEMEPSKAYYFRFGHKNILGTMVSGREPLTLTPVDEATARQEMDGLRQAVK